MYWIKEFNRDQKDPNAIAIAILYHQYLKEGDKKDQIGYFYRSVTEKGNKAEKKTYEIINRTLGDSDFSGVSNVRIDSKYDKMRKMAAEFDFIIEDKKLVVYVNVKSSDESNKQPEQIKRHEEILGRMIPNGKELKTLSIITKNGDSCTKFEQQLQEYAINQKNDKKEQNNKSLKDDVFCNILHDIDVPIMHINCVLKQFDINKDDFTDDRSYNKFIHNKNKESVQSVQSEKILIKGKIIKVISRKSDGKPTDILVTDNQHYEKVYIPVGTSKPEWEGKSFEGFFIKEEGKKPPYIGDMNNDFKIIEDKHS